MRYISVGRRALAILIDSLIGSVWWYPLAERIHHPDGGLELRFNGGRGFLVVLIFITYAFVMETAFGATIGKFVVGIRVVMEDGSKLTPTAALVRNLLRLVDALPFLYLVGAVVIWAGGPKRQRIGDRVAKTVVIPAGASVMVEPTMAPPPPPPPAPTVPPPPPMP